MTDQIAVLKKQNLKFVDFASKSVQQLFTNNEIEKATVKQFNYAASCIAYNDGKGNFNVKKLPPAIQFSSVNAILVQDVNDDGRKDIIMAGNDFGFQPQFCRLDASYGNILLNKGNFILLDAGESGLCVRGEVRDIVSINVKGKKQLLFLQNNQKPVMYKVVK
jgi:enediyne biosynthesis protein E4